MASYKDKIRAALDALVASSPYEAHKLIVRNADGSIDGEARFIVPRGTHEKDIIRSVRALSVPRNTWVTIGTRYEESAITDESKDRYLRWRGFREATHAYEPASQKEELISKALRISEKMRDAYDRKASEVVVRLNYTPGNLARTENKAPAKKGRLTSKDKGLARKARKRKGRK